MLTHGGIDQSPLLDLLMRYIDVPNVYASDIDFGLCTFSLRSRSSLKIWRSDIPQEQFFSYIMASSALPGLRTVKLDDQVYLDGGIGDNLPFDMLRFGSETAKSYYKAYMLKPEHAKAHEAGDIHIHDLDFYSLTMTCCQIDLLKLFEGGFNTGHGHLRKPQDIRSYAALACIAIQSNQNDMHGGQSIPNFDYVMADGVRCTYKKEYRLAMAAALELISGIPTETSEPKIKAMVMKIEKDTGRKPELSSSSAYDEELFTSLREIIPELASVAADQEDRILAYTRKHELFAFIVARGKGRNNLIL